MRSPSSRAWRIADLRPNSATIIVCVYSSGSTHAPAAIAGGEPCPRPMITAAMDPATNVALMMIVTVGPLTGTITADAGSGGNDGGERRMALRYLFYNDTATTAAASGGPISAGPCTTNTAAASDSNNAPAKTAPNAA